MSCDPTQISAQPPPPAEPVHDHAQEHAKRRMSKGEKAFNWLTYGGVAGVVTFALGLPVAYWSRYTKEGEALVKWTAKHVKNIGLSEHAAEDVVMTTALMMGGNATLLPVMELEKNKEKIVTRLNEKLGDDTELLKSDDKPKQTWTSVLSARFIAWGAVFGALRGAAHVGGKEGFDQFEHNFSKNLVCEPLGQATHIKGEETFLYRMGRMAAIDVFATASAAALLYLGTRILAKREKAAQAADPAQPAAGAFPAPAEAPHTQPAPAQPGPSTLLVAKNVTPSAGSRQKAPTPPQPAGDYRELVQATPAAGIPHPF